MLDGLKTRLDLLVRADASLLQGMQRGIEKEGLRVLRDGRISQSNHPEALGCTLTHPHITTDYAEPLLELITPVCDSVEALMGWLGNIHRFVHQNLADGEVLWNSSMPCRLAGDESIRIAEYGDSNLGRLKYVYRKGLEVRYGRLMQSIAGIHYNWSMRDSFWTAYASLLNEPDDCQDFRSRHYFGLIRNFRRWSWLLMYLFGASPALDRSFLRHEVPGLMQLDDHTLASPFATSLRMGDLGYKNDAQSGLFVCFNHLKSYIKTLDRAMHTPHPPYEVMGVKRGDEYIQLNTNVLQIENEYYNSIRPKRVALESEKPLEALAARGVQYVEVRCLDINPFTPFGIDAQQARFMDVFLLTCLLAPSPLLGDSECQTVQQNFNMVVSSGRAEGLMLLNDLRQWPEVSLADWASEILDAMAMVAEQLDQLAGDGLHQQALAWAREQIHQPRATRSAQVLESLSQTGQSYVDWALACSTAFSGMARDHALDVETFGYFQEMARQSWADEATLRASDSQTFEDYLKAFLH